MWKERLWQMFLVAILGLVLTMCSRTSSNNSTSSSGILNADGTTTTVTVSSLPTVTLANAGPSAISHTMFCGASLMIGSRRTYHQCDASDSTKLGTLSNYYYYTITHDASLAAGWKLVGPGCSVGSNAQTCYLFHK